MLSRYAENYDNAMRLMDRGVAMLACGDDQWFWARTIEESKYEIGEDSDLKKEDPVALLFNQDRECRLLILKLEPPNLYLHQD